MGPSSRRNLGFLWGLPASKKPEQTLGAGYDLNTRCEALGNLGPPRAAKGYRRRHATGYHLVALLHFDNLAAIQGAFGSAEGQAAVPDVQNFATGGVDIFMFDTRPV
jgi:hypothetical protein